MNATQIETWLVTDGMGEFVMYYNQTGCVMHFTRDREQAWKTTDSHDAFEVARIAREVYRRKWMKMSMSF